MTWREDCRPIIAKVLADNKGKTEKEIKKALQNAYPYGERARHPYKTWCDEINIQRGLKKQKNNPVDNPNQIDLLDLIKESEVSNG